MWEEWVSSAVARLGGNQAELSRRLAAQLRRTEDRGLINKILNQGRDVSAEEMLAIADITGEPIPGTVAVPLINWVSAGALLAPEVTEPGEVQETMRFFGLGNGDFFALKVHGDSMDRVSPDGSVIVINRRERDLIDGKAYVFVTHDGATYKLWRRRPPRLDPFSTNPTHQPLFLDPETEPNVVGRVVQTTKNL